jgi:phosphoribosylformylglycinamidine cyclo-ligase
MGIAIPSKSSKSQKKKKPYNKEGGKGMENRSAATYQDAGVDIEREDIALHRLTQRVQQTWPIGNGIGAVKLPIGYYANVIDIGGTGLAITTDGVGTKVIIAHMMEKYNTIGIDCVAMNVNDLICVGARPISMVDYLALQDLDPDLVDEIFVGLCEGAKEADISISGGETAQLRDIMKGYNGRAGFDLAGAAVGIVPLDKIITGKDIKEGDVVIGIESNGVHSNGLTMARRIFFAENTYTVKTMFPTLERSLGEELLRPTHIYVKEVLGILNSREITVKALLNITGGGFLNLTRVESEVRFVIEQLPDPPSIFSLIQTCGHVSDEEMFRVYNMGIGFCLVVPSGQEKSVLSMVSYFGKKAHILGYTIPDKSSSVFVKPKGISGRGNRFSKIREE